MSCLNLTLPGFEAGKFLRRTLKRAKIQIHPPVPHYFRQIQLEPLSIKIEALKL